MKTMTTDSLKNKANRIQHGVFSLSCLAFLISTPTALGSIYSSETASFSGVVTGVAAGSTSSVGETVTWEMSSFSVDVNSISYTGSSNDYTVYFEATGSLSWTLPDASGSYSVSYMSDRLGYFFTYADSGTSVYENNHFAYLPSDANITITQDAGDSTFYDGAALEADLSAINFDPYWFNTWDFSDYDYTAYTLSDFATAITDAFDDSDTQSALEDYLSNNQDTAMSDLFALLSELDDDPDNTIFNFPLGNNKIPDSTTYRGYITDPSIPEPSTYALGMALTTLLCVYVLKRRP